MQPRRIIGTLVPVLFSVTFVFEQSIQDFVSDNLILSFFLVGLCSALLMGTWWSVLIAPALIPASLLTLQALTRDTAPVASGEIESFVAATLLWSLIVMVPAILGAAIGSMFVARSEMPQRI